MRKSCALGSAICIFGVLLASPLLAQTRPTSSLPPSTSTNGKPTTARGRGEPCWKQAGISQSVIREHHSIEQSTRSEIAAVCNDTSLTSQQRHEKARQIREQARQRQDAMLSSSQRSAFQSCRAQRGEGGTPGLGGESLCGEARSTRGVRPAQGSVAPNEN